MKSSPTIALQRTRSVSLRSGLKSDVTYTFQVTPDPGNVEGTAVTVFYLGKTLNFDTFTSDFIGTVGPDGLPHADLFVMNPNGRDVLQVTHTPDAEGGPAWDPRPFRGQTSAIK